MPNKDLNTNEVIVNGQVIMSTRNDTVSPQTLVKDETATNKEGAKIVGELDPVYHDEAYLIDDPEGDIDDSDYIPFNDVSDEEQPKKKTLFSSIVDKLRTIFVSKSWGHVELLSTTETLGIKDKEVDATASDNGVTANHYPSSNDIRDNNNKIIARSEAIVYPSGTITAKMYAQNYDANGNSVGQNAINLNVDKSGVFSYNVSDPNAFRSAIKTVDQLGTDIPSNADLNTYKTAGTYRVPSDAIGATISNLPLALCGKVVVFNNGNGGFEQFYFPNHNPKIYVRTWWDNAWSSWKEIGEGGDSKPHTYEVGTSIPASSDLNTYIDDGVYKIAPDATAQTIVNIPSHDNTITGGKLVVSKGYSANENYIIQTYYSNDNYIFVRRSEDSGTTWVAWKQLASTDDISPSTVGDGYAVATVSGSAITATISGFKLRAGAIVAIRMGRNIPANATLNINNTGAKNIQYVGQFGISNVGAQDFRHDGVYTFIYTGSVYMMVARTNSAVILTHDYVADTSGDIAIESSHNANVFQLKYYIARNRLYWNYYKNSVWSGDKALVEEIESGIIRLYRETTTADDLPVGLEASIKDTTTGETFLYRILRAYQDHQATPYGLNLLLCGGGNTIIGGGESSVDFYTNEMTSEQKIAENLYLLSDGAVILESNAQTIANRTGLKIVDSKLIPIKAEVNTDNFFDLGSSSNKFKGVYAHNMFLHSPQGRTVVGGAHSLGVSDTIPNILNELRYSNGAWGSFNLTTAYTKDYTTIPTGWYNYFYIPHRVGGENWAKPTSWDADNVNFGTLMLFGMNNTNGMFRLRWQLSNDAVSVTELEDLQKGNCYVGTCTTAGGTKDKVATVDGNFVLRKGVRVAIKFTNTNTYSNVTSSPITLNVNNTGAKNIWYASTHSGAGNTGTSTTIYGVGGRYHFYVYDGTYWVFDSHSMDNNNTNYLRNDASSIAKVNDASPYITLKSSVVDITQSNNGVSSTSYPAFIIEDKNGKSLARLEAIVETGGNVAAFLQVRNYKSDGTNPNGGIKVFMNKNGAIWYVISSAESFNAALGHGWGTCTTAAATTEKAVTLTNYGLFKNGIVVVRFDNDVPANATMNINSKGAKPIYHHGSVIKAGVIKGGDRALFIYDGAQYLLVAIDRTDYIFKNYSYNNSAGTPTEVTIDDTNIQLPQFHYYVKGDMVMVSFIIKFVSAKNYGTSNVKLFHGLYAPKQHVFCESQGKSFYLDTSGNFYIRGLSQSVTAGQTLWGITLTYIR